MIKFKQLLEKILMETLHQEIQDTIKSKSVKSKQSAIAAKIRDLTNRGEKTGIEGNMPKGSSRLYLHEEDQHACLIDGKSAKLNVGTKVAIKASLDKTHDKSNYDGKSLGELQNHAEGGDYWVNKNYRILTKPNDEKEEYHSNKDSGIFPPLIDHDHDGHQWTRVGHCEDVGNNFRELTKTDSHPNGISHKDFCDALERLHHQSNGKYWKGSVAREAHLDHVEAHPLVQKFMDYHSSTANPPYDYRQKKNMGVFHHPDGSAHIVARDHGYNNYVESAYRKARLGGRLG